MSSALLNLCLEPKKEPGSTATATTAAMFESDAESRKSSMEEQV